MKSHLVLNNKKVFYTDKGHGAVIVLLHGYLESLEIWSDFSTELSKKYRVISFDIPGHGDSEIVSKNHSMKNLAEIIYKSLNVLKINKCLLIGHSMGGYLTLMMHKLFPELLLGFCLFHSHPFADTEETKKKRLREIELVKDGRKDLIAKFNIPNAFATDNIKKFNNEAKRAIEIALQTSENGIIANLNTMMNRPDFSESLSNSSIPFLYILGKKDNYIDYKLIGGKVVLPQLSELCVLEKSGHMGFIEEKEKSLSCIMQFINRII
ncbi:alpha/beta fold hydrolase [Bacteroidota bacterium]